MNLQYNYEENERDVVFYILGYLIFVSTFFIASKVLEISLVVSLILFCILTMASVAYILNIKKYSLFKSDIVVFNLLYYGFGIYLIINVFEAISISQLTGLETVLVYTLIGLNFINYAATIFKISKTVLLGNGRIFFILMAYCFVTFFIILSFSWVFLGKTNNSIENYISDNFTFDGASKKYTSKMKEYELIEYLTYDEKRFRNMFKQNSYDDKGIKGYIELKYNPVSRIEDYIMFSAQNYFSGDNGGIKAEGKGMMYLAVVEKGMFALVSLIGMVGLIDLYRAKEE